MSINIRNKGANGEREAIALLNSVIESVLAYEPWPEDVVNISRKCIQRNQNQSAVGGQDLCGVFGLSVEIKRHETLHVNAWWKQCTEQAERNAELPVLMYRQNRQPWAIVMPVSAALPGDQRYAKLPRATLDEESFKTWFWQWVYYSLVEGNLPRI